MSSNPLIARTMPRMKKSIFSPNEKVVPSVNGARSITNELNSSRRIRIQRSHLIPLNSDAESRI